MKIGKEWESFRITLLLYIIVIVIPLTFYFVHNSFNSLKEDTRVMKQIGWINAILETHSADKLNIINKRLDEVSVWVNLNNNSEFYLGSQTLKKDFSDVKSCLNNKSTMVSQSIKCSDTLKNLTVIIENMVYLKEDKLINLFYLTLSIVMILTLILIYMVRHYIETQIIKHAIYDTETKLFNKKYFTAQLKTACASAIRREQPLSIVSVFIPDMESENSTYSKNDKKHIFRVFGALLDSTVRDCDVACRYEDGLFFIMLPDTKKENAVFLEVRVDKIVKEHNFEVVPKPEFKFEISEYDRNKNPKMFIEEVLKES